MKKEYIKYMDLQILHRNEFGKLLDQLNLKGLGAEIGVCEGKFSRVLLDNTKLYMLYLIDPWKDYGTVSLGFRNLPQEKQDRLYSNVVKNTQKYGDRVQIIRNESVKASSFFSDETFDFVYIDANHSYKYVKEDIAYWYPKVRKGAILAGHDYMDGIIKGVDYGVKRAADEFCAANNKKIYTTSGLRKRARSWYFIK